MDGTAQTTPGGQVGKSKILTSADIPQTVLPDLELVDAIAVLSVQSFLQTPTPMHQALYEKAWKIVADHVTTFHEKGNDAYESYLKVKEYHAQKKD